MSESIVIPKELLERVQPLGPHYIRLNGKNPIDKGNRFRLTIQS